eukprot:COSAG01_NODE_7008_length_3394_cov_3.696813_1_plen_66_part_00
MERESWWQTVRRGGAGALRQRARRDLWPKLKWFLCRATRRYTAEPTAREKEVQRTVSNIMKDTWR